MSLGPIRLIGAVLLRVHENNLSIFLHTDGGLETSALWKTSALPVVTTVCSRNRV